MITYQWFPDIIVTEKFLAVAGILAGNQVDFFENIDSTHGDVPEVAQGCRDNIKS